jgi:type I restriction enzyme S subunit
MGVPHLTQEIMNKIKILIPPIKEQMAISDYLDAKCAEIDAAAEAKRQQLTTLDEYKKSLIFEYVTGKKEV